MDRNFTHYTNAVQRMVPVKLKHLFVFITCFVISSNHRSLFASSAEKNINSIDLNTGLNLMNNDFMTLADNICNYLLLGHTTDEIIEMLNDNQELPYNINIEKLVTHIQSLLNKKYSKDNVINIFVSNKESENFYIQKKFWNKIKNTYFVLKSTAVLVIIVVVFYLLYLLAQWLKFKFPWFGHKDQHTGYEGSGTGSNSSGGNGSGGSSSCGSSKLPANGKIPNTSQCSFAQAQKKAEQSSQETTGTIFTHTEGLQASSSQLEYQKKGVHPTATQEIAGKETQSHDTVAIDAQQAHQQNADMLTQGAQATSQSIPETQGSEGFGSCLPDDEILDLDELDLRLSRLITKQIEQAKKVGLETKIIQFDATKESRELGDYIPVGERVLRQVEYAKSVGLVPH